MQGSPLQQNANEVHSNAGQHHQPQIQTINQVPPNNQEFVNARQQSNNGQNINQPGYQQNINEVPSNSININAAKNTNSDLHHKR